MNSKNNLERLKTAGGMSRLWHWLTESKFGIISAERGNKTPQENKERTLELKKILAMEGYGFYPATGFWEGVSESSFFVPQISKEVLLDVGKHFDQDAIIFGDQGESGLYDCVTGDLLFPKIDVKKHFQILSEEEKAKLEEEKAEIGFTRVKRDKDTFTIDPNLEEWRKGSSMRFLILSDSDVCKKLTSFKKVVTAESVDGNVLKENEKNFYHFRTILAMLPMGHGLLDDTNFNSTVHRSY
jgi:hypothetical protein